MTKSELEKTIKAQPFVPLRIYLTNGTTYDLARPDGILLSEWLAAIAVGGAIALVALIHINEIQTLPTMAP